MLRSAKSATPLAPVPYVVDGACCVYFLFAFERVIMASFVLSGDSSILASMPAGIRSAYPAQSIPLSFAEGQVQSLTEDELEDINAALGPVAIRVVGGAVIGGVMGGISSHANGGFSWKAVGVGALGGALSGGFAGWLKVKNL